MIKKAIKILSIGLLSLLTLLAISYFVFVFNAEKIVKEIVTYYTKGTMKIEMKKLKFNPRELRITIINAEISTVDTAHQYSTYDISVDTMLLELASIRPLLLDRKLYIDSITFKRPSISVTQWKEVKKEKFSLPQQMGKVYTSLNHTLDKLSIKYCLLDSGAFSIEDKVHPERKKVAVTDFYFLIDNLHKPSSLNQDDRFFFSDRIKFYSSHQNITLASGNTNIRYSRLRINSARKIIELDSCYVYSKKSENDFNSFSGFFDTLKFTNVDFKRLTQESILDADSAYCINPKLTLKTSIIQQKKENNIRQTMTKDSFSTVMKSLLGNFNLDYIGVDNASIKIQTNSASKISSYDIKRTDFSIHDVSVIDHPDSVIKVGSFDLGLIGYQAYDPDSSYLVKFDSIHFINDKIFLSNFNISPSKKIITNEFKDIRMSSLAINGISWFDLLANKKIVAKDIELINPEIDLHLSTKLNSGKPKSRTPVIAALKRMTDYADVENLKISNANFKMSQVNRVVALNNLNCTLPVNRILQSRTINDFLSASVFLDFESAKIALERNQIALKKGKYNGPKSILQINEVLAADDKKSFHAYFQNLVVSKPSEKSTDYFDLSSLSWDKASVSFDENAKNKKTDKLKSKTFITIAKIQGKNTSFQIKGKSFTTNGLLSKIEVSNLATEENGNFSLKDLIVKGNKISMINKGLGVNINQIDFHNKKTTLIEDLNVNSDSGKNKIELNIPKLVFTTDINDLIKKQYNFENVVISAPSVDFSNNDNYIVKTEPSLSSKLPEININSVEINNTEIHGVAFEEKVQPFVKKIQSSIRFNDIHVQNEKVRIHDGFFKLADVKLKTPKLSLIIPADTALSLSLNNINIELPKNQNKLKWSFKLDNLISDNFTLKLHKDTLSEQQVNLTKTKLSDVNFNNNSKFLPFEIVAASPEFSLQHGSVDFSNNQSRFQVLNLNYSNKLGKINIDSFSFRPNSEKADFVRANDYQKDYPIFTTGKINVNGFSLLKLFQDSVFVASNVNVTQPDLYIFKDKRKPFKKGVYKPLPSKLLKNIKIKFDVDSVIVNKGGVVYEELNEKTQKTGIVKFKELNAIINGFKNSNHNEKDSLRLYVTGKFMDSAKIRFRFSESFTDSLHSFTYGLRFRSFDFKILNPILEPLVSARIISGSLDTLRVNAIGREHMSHGKMKMYYKDLKIQYLNKGSDSVKNLKSRLINFVANDLLLKRNNKKGMGIVYAERDKERGFANYWLKIGLSGVVSSSGVKKNKKVEKIYRRKLKKMKVPDIPDVDL